MSSAFLVFFTARRHIIENGNALPEFRGPKTHVGWPYWNRSGLRVCPGNAQGVATGRFCASRTLLISRFALEQGTLNKRPAIQQSGD